MPYISTDFHIIEKKSVGEWERSYSGRVEGKGGAAELLGVNPNALRNRMKKLGIPYRRKKRHRKDDQS